MSKCFFKFYSGSVSRSIRRTLIETNAPYTYRQSVEFVMLAFLHRECNLALRSAAWVKYQGMYGICKFKLESIAEDIAFDHEHDLWHTITRLTQGHSQVSDIRLVGLERFKIMIAR